MAKTAQEITAKPATGPAASKKNYIASTLLLLSALFFLLAILSLNFINPSDSYAHPSYGFTPQPPPPPPPPGGDDSDEDEDDSDLPPPHDVTVQIEPCDLSCSTGLGRDQGGTLLASASTNNPLFQTAGPASYKPFSLAPAAGVAGVPTVGMAPTARVGKAGASANEMLLHVRLIHLGSGWITEGLISDTKPVNFAVPYPGDWQVFLLDPPEFAGGDSPDLTATNLETLQTNLAKGPLYLGVVQADTGQPQQLPCPLNCPTAASDFTPAPAALPESGAANLPPPLLPFIGAALLWAMALLSYQRYRLLLLYLNQPENDE